MSRRDERKMERAAAQASEAARILQARSQEARQENKAEATPSVEDTNEGVRRPEPTRTDRDDAMDEVVSRHERGFGEPPPAESEPPEEPALQATETPVVPETPAAETPAAPAAPAAPAVETVKVKVDGEEFEVPKAEVDAAGGVTAYQKDRAADNRLKRANDTLAETKRTQAQIAAWIAQQTQAAQPKPQNADEFLQANIDTIRFGTPEESAAALRKWRELSTPQINPEHIVNDALMRMQQNQGIQKFAEEFQDIATNPLLVKLAVQLKNDKLTELQKRGQSLPEDWSLFYRSIGNEIRSVIGRPSQPAAANPADPSSTVVDKEARKASIVNLPKAAARAALPEDPKPETREEVLAAMRASRLP